MGRKYCIKMEDFKFPDTYTITDVQDPAECLRYDNYYIVRMSMTISEHDDGNDDKTTRMHIRPIR